MIPPDAGVRMMLPARFPVAYAGGAPGVALWKIPNGIECGGPAGIGACADSRSVRPTASSKVSVIPSTAGGAAVETCALMASKKATFSSGDNTSPPGILLCMADAWIEIPLGGRKHTGFVAIIDVDDYWPVNRYRWRVKLDKNGEPAYAQTGTSSRITMHQLVTGLTGEQVDHKDRSGFNNRHKNLRPATTSQNKRNSDSYRNSSSEYKGVHWNKASKKWHAQIMYEGKNHYLGLFDSEIAAALAYDEASCKLHGEFGRCNFPL